MGFESPQEGTVGLVIEVAVDTLVERSRYEAAETPVHQGEGAQIWLTEGAV